MRIGVIVATNGRAAEVKQSIARLNGQTMVPSSILVSAVTDRDVPPDLGQNVETIYGSAGLCAQRNRALELLLGQSEIIVYPAQARIRKSSGEMIRKLSDTVSQ
jgi:hypothetical protein